MGEAFLIAVYLINRIPSVITSSISPFERLYSQSPDYHTLRVFGCTCFVLLPKVARTKLFARSVLCVFLGYSDGQKGYRCYDPLTRKLYLSRHVVFIEHIPFFFSIPSTTDVVSKNDLVYLDPFPLILILVN